MIAAVRSVMQASSGVGIEAERVVDLGEHGHRAGGDDRVDGGDERERGNDDLVAAADAERRERAAQRRGAVGDGDRVRAAERRRTRPARSRRPRRRRRRPCSGTANGSGPRRRPRASSSPSSAAPFANQVAEHARHLEVDVLRMASSWDCRGSAPVSSLKRVKIVRRIVGHAGQHCGALFDGAFDPRLHLEEGMRRARRTSRAPRAEFGPRRPAETSAASARRRIGLI